MSLFEDLVNDFIDQTSRAHGQLARPNDTVYSCALVSEALAYLRSQCLDGRALTDRGRRFVAGAAAYMGYVLWSDWRERGLDVTFSAELGGDHDHVVVGAQREREGQQDVCALDILRDALESLLVPPSPFPYMQPGAAIYLRSASLLSPEFCYVLSAHFLASPFAGGGWPVGDGPGGTQADFDTSRSLLIGHLHRDLGIETEDEGVRRLSHWVVWPLYGWQQNDVGEYNMMTLIDQIAVKRIVGLETGIAYLRALLHGQTFHLRNLAARCLMILGQPANDPLESTFYANAVHASDMQQAEGHMVALRWRLEGRDPQQAPDQDFAASFRALWQETLSSSPKEPWRQTPILRDADYARIGQLPPERTTERLEGAESLLERYPNDWFARVLRAATLLRTERAPEAEAALREAMASNPDCSSAHFVLGPYLSGQGRIEEAREVMDETVRLWPWDGRAVANAMWLLTRDLVC